MWLQLYWDMQIANDLEEAEKKPEWRKRGESVQNARDRLKAERQAAKERLGVV